MQLMPQPKRAQKGRKNAKKNAEDIVKDSKRLIRPASKHLQKSLVAAAVASIIAGPAVVWAQTAESTLHGKAQPGATITARNVASGAVRHATAGIDGFYTLAGLEAGTYRVDAGAGTEQDISIGVSSSVGFDFIDSAARQAELAEVVVTGKVHEVRTSEVGTEVSLQQIETVPQITRNFLEFADTVPGMIFSVDNSGNTSIRGGAQVDNNINVYIDGVGMKDYVQDGGVSGQTGQTRGGDPGNPFPQLAIQEYKVITSNYKAEFDQVSSSVITAQTKSGSNVFEGEAFGDFTNQNLRAETPAEDSANNKVKGETDEYGFAQGGPIIKDVLHFFVSYEHKDLALPNVVFPPGNQGDTLQNLKGILPPSVYSQYGPTSDPFTEDLIFAKLDWEPSDSDRFELTNLTRLETSVSGAGNQNATSAAINFENNNERIALLWQHDGGNYLNEARITYQSEVAAPESTSAGNLGTIYEYFYPTPAQPLETSIQVNAASAASYSKYAQEGYGFQDDLTLSNVRFYGDNTFKMGVKYQAVDLTARDAGSGGLVYYGLNNAGLATTPYQAVFSLTNPGQNPTAVSDDRQIGVYFQDTWVPTSRLTLDIGIRWDYETVPSYDNFQLPASIVQGINGAFPGSPGETYAQALAKGGIDINDYIGDGHNRSPQTDEFAPRLGFSYDASGDNRVVLFGGYARAYDRNTFNNVALENTRLALSTPTVSFYGSGFSNGPCQTAAQKQTQAPVCAAFTPAEIQSLSALQALATGNYGEIDLINNNLKDPYSDQFSLGIRDRIGDWNTSVTVAQINSYNGILGHLGNRYADGAYYQNGVQWGSPGIPGTNGNLILYDNDQRDRDTQVLVSAEKPYTKESHWGATVAYTYSHALQNNTAPYGSNPNAFEFDLPFPSLYPMLDSSSIPRHRLVLTGSIDGPWGLLLGAKVSLATPLPDEVINPCPPNTLCQNGFNAYPVVAYPHTVLQEKNVDLQITKNFNIYRDIVSSYLRLDVLNVFNAPFYANYTFSPNTTGSYLPPAFNTTAAIFGVPRELKFTAGVKW